MTQIALLLANNWCKHKHVGWTKVRVKLCWCSNMSVGTNSSSANSLVLLQTFIVQIQASKCWLLHLLHDVLFAYLVLHFEFASAQDFIQLSYFIKCYIRRNISDE